MAPSSRGSVNGRVAAVVMVAAAIVIGLSVYLFWQQMNPRPRFARVERGEAVSNVAPAPVAGGGRTATPTDRDVPAIRFTNVTAQAGIGYVQWTGTSDLQVYKDTGGAAAADYDNDGWIDLYVTRQDAPPILYRNVGPHPLTGEVLFKDVTEQAGLDQPAMYSNGALWADFDNDGHVDLFVTTVGDHRYYLFMNRGDGTFSEEATGRGAELANTIPRYGTSAAAGDFDNDGYLDIAVGEWMNELESNERSGFALLRNLGPEKPGYFEDVTRAAGIVMPLYDDPDSPEVGPTPVSFAPRFTDLDADGWPDLAITSDYETSRLFWNNGDGTFTDGTLDAGVGTGRSEMGSAIADYDGDGRLDWFVTAIHYGNPQLPDGNRLYRNLGNRQFSEHSLDAGVDDAYWGWGTAFVDYDHDTWPDLVATNGMPKFFGGRFDADPSRLWRNNGQGGAGTTFTDVAADSGITDTASGKGLLVFDYDNDGDPDVFIANNAGGPILYRNDGANATPWLRVRAVGTESNRDGLGAFVTVTDDRIGRPLVWEISSGSQYLGQSETTAHFGLSSRVTDRVQKVEVRWPKNGRTQVFTDVPVNATLTVEESSDEPLIVVAPRPEQRGPARQPATQPSAPVDENVATDVVLDWNRTLLRAVAETNRFDTATQTGGDRPPQVGRDMAMVHLAIYDAVNSFDRAHEPYGGFVDISAGASKDAAAAQAAMDVLVHLYGERSHVRSRMNTTLSALRDAGVSDDAIAAGRSVGSAAAQRIIAMRAADGSANTFVCDDDFTFGRYRMDRITPGANVDCLAPHWVDVKPFALTRPSQFRQAGPPPFDSPAYAAAVNEVRELGDRHRYDPSRYPDGKLPDDVWQQKCIAFFWAAKGLNADSAKNAAGTTTPPGHWNEIARTVSQQRGLSLEENARLFALLNVAMADAGIAAWDMKYHHYLWRPIHAVRQPAPAGDPNHNPQVVADADWMPLIPTSNHPEYPSGHSTFSGAAAEVLSRFFGTDAVPFSCTGDDALVDPNTGRKEVRTFPGFWAAAREAGQSRIYGGIHYQFANTDGLNAGREIGGYVVQHTLQPIQQAESAHPAALAPGSPR